MDADLAQNYIEHRADGPLTPFVLISRAMRLVAEGTPPDVAANALSNSLEGFGWLVDDEDALIETGS